jgi:hypothetical protein
MLRLFSSLFIKFLSLQITKQMKISDKCYKKILIILLLINQFTINSVLQILILKFPPQDKPQSILELAFNVN